MSAQQPDPISPPLISSAAASPARISLTLERVLGWLVRALACGESTRESLARFDPGSLSWRTSQRCLDGEQALFSETWPASGTMRSGRLYAPRMSERRTEGSDCLSWPTADASSFNATEAPETFLARQAVLKSKGVNGNGCGTPLAMAVRLEWPTPTASENANRNTKPCPSHGVSHGRVLASEVNRTWPTPAARDWKDGDGTANVPTNGLLGRQATRDPSTTKAGSLNPAWVCQLQGFPNGWLDGPPVPAKRSAIGKRPASSASATTEPQDSKPSATP